MAADSAGWLMYHILRIRRDTIDEQLEMAFGNELSNAERQAIGCKSWQNCVLTFFEFLQPSPWLSKGWDEFRAQEGYDEYCEPLKKSHGSAFVITAHIGNWEALGSLAEREHVQLAAVAKAMHNPLVNNYILKSRAKRGLEVLQLKGNMKGIVDAARAGKWVAIVGDQDARRSGIFVDFFGRPASTAVGAAHFAWKLDKPLLPSFCVRLPDAGRHLKLVFMEPVYPDPTADRDEEMKRITQLHTRALEEVIRRYPSDYFWLHRRWKTKPKTRKGRKRVETVA
jgi:KDO2-lipid IV(A) lauroyltransferase